MTERSPEPIRLTNIQEVTLRHECELYGLDFFADHYQPDPEMGEGWVSGILGGPDGPHRISVGPEEVDPPDDNDSGDREDEE